MEAERRQRAGTALVLILVASSIVILSIAFLAGMPRPLLLIVGLTLLCVDAVATAMVWYSRR